jgi:hypothetical protein
MRTCLASFRHRPRFVAACFLCSLFAAPLLTAGAARAQEGFAGWSAGGDGSFASSAQKPVDPPQSAPRWTFSAETIVLGRWGGANQPLVSRVPGDVPFYVYPTPTPPSYDSATYPGVEALNSDQFRQGFSAGPKLSLTYHDDSGYGVELSYFDVLGLSAAKAIGPDSPRDWLVMKAPGSFWQTQDFPYQAMAWSDASSLYSAEVNGRLDLSSRVTVLAGPRWLQLNDKLVGWLTPADRTAPDWKQHCSLYSLLDLPTDCPSAYYPGGTAGSYPPFWQANTKNNLYGAQIGVDAKLLELGRFSLDGLIKAGVFDNDAEQTTVVSMAKQLYTAQATTNAAAFAGEADLQVKYQLARGLTLTAGYEALWLDGVALAPGQIRETYTTSPSPASPSTPVSARALGVNCGSNVLFQGATVGLEYSF